MIIAELSGRCRQLASVLGEEGHSLGNKDMKDLKTLTEAMLT